MLEPPSTIVSHARFLLENLKDSDLDSSVHELCDALLVRRPFPLRFIRSLRVQKSEIDLDRVGLLVSFILLIVYVVCLRWKFVDHRVETSVPVVLTCLGWLTFNKSLANRLLLEKAVSSVFKHAMKMPNFSTILSRTLKDVDVTEDFVVDLSNALRLSASEKIAFALAFSDLERSDARMSGRNFCVAEIEKLCVNLFQMESTEQIQNIILFLRKSEDLSKHLDSFFQILSSAQSREDLHFVLTPFLSEDVLGADIFRGTHSLNDTAVNDFNAILAEIEKEIGVGDLVDELGYGLTADATQCKEILFRFLPLTEATIWNGGPYLCWS